MIDISTIYRYFVMNTDIRRLQYRLFMCLFIGPSVYFSHLVRATSLLEKTF